MGTAAQPNEIIPIDAVVMTPAGVAKTSGTVEVRIKLNDPGGTDDGKFWDTNAGGSWQASVTTWPTATYMGSGAGWSYDLPAAATSGLTRSSLDTEMSDNLDTPASATVVSSTSRIEVVEDASIIVIPVDPAGATLRFGLMMLRNGVAVTPSAFTLSLRIQDDVAEIATATEATSGVVLNTHNMYSVSVTPSTALVAGDAVSALITMTDAIGTITRVWGSAKA